MACSSICLPERTYYRWTQEIEQFGSSADKRPTASHPEPENKLTAQERERMFEIIHSERYSDQTPHEIVPSLADEGIYICSERTMYRYMAEENEQRRRGRRVEAKGGKRPTTWTATGPGQVWVWDITYLPSTVKGIYFYMYLITDIWSRYPVGMEVYAEQSGDLARELFARTIVRERIDMTCPPVLHSDNGKPMKSQVLQALLADYGILPSYSRPSVSNDNAYAESAFSTAKGRPDYPGNFETLEDARKWATGFLRWARTEHHHSGINYLTPEQRHTGKAEEILKARQKVYEEARAQHPNRWNGRDTRDWTLKEEVYLNPSKEAAESDKTRKKARNKKA